MFKHLLRTVVALLLLSAVVSAVSAQGEALPLGHKEPLLRLQAGGPTSNVTGLTFSPDGGTLYAAGWDKIVHVWKFQDGTWVAGVPYRVPVGPEDNGAINALALSADGKWLAVGGVGVMRGRAVFGERGMVVPIAALDSDMRQDQGNIFVFNTQTRAARVLRGHQGSVKGLAFAPPANGAKADEPPPLLSAAWHVEDKTAAATGSLWLWDFAKGKGEAVVKGASQTWPGKLPAADRVGLTAWRDGDNLQLASAWLDKKLRLWNPAQAPGATERDDDRQQNGAVLALPQLKTLLTAGVRAPGPGGYLQAWSAPDGKPGTTYPPANQLAPGNLYFPSALAAFPSKPGAEVDQVAVAVAVAEPGIKRIEDAKLRLHLLDFSKPGQLGKLWADLPVRYLGGVIPPLAASPDGRFIAVGGNAADGILIYEVKDIRDNGVKSQPWKRASKGVAHIQALFVVGAKGQKGLLLRESAGPRGGIGPKELVFDFSKPGLVSGDGWQIDQVAPGGWTVAPDDPKAPKALKIAGGGAGWDLKLPAGESVTDYALLPPRAPLNVPVLAVASRSKSNEPKLVLYWADKDSKSFKVIRHLTGHDGQVRSVAFSGDGKLLVSAAEDQTVCLWSMTDLDKILGVHGLIEGLAVQQTDKAVRVAEINAGSPAAGKLAKGDVLSSLRLPNKKELKLESAEQFFRTIWDEFKPGTTVGLSVGGKEIDIKAGQAVDERQPLLTLFVTRAAQRDQGDWVAWNPQGPYVGSPNADSFLNWHVNTGKPDSPVAVADAAKTRKLYQKPAGFLKELVDKAALEMVDLAPPRLPDPKVFVRIGGELLDGINPDENGRIKIRPKEIALRVTVLDFPPEKIKGVAWLDVDGKEQPLAIERELAGGNGSDWKAELPKTWTAGDKLLRVVVRTPDAERTEHRKNYQVSIDRWHNPAPTVAILAPEIKPVMQPAVTVKARIIPGLPGVAVDVRLFVKNKAIAVDAKKDLKELADGSLILEKAFDLEAGVNVIKVEAENRDAPAGFKEVERRTEEIALAFAPKMDIALDKAIPLQGDAVEQTIKWDLPVVVQSSKIKIRGYITSTEALVDARRELNGEPKALQKFAPGGMKFAIDEEIVLKPGVNRVVFKTETKTLKSDPRTVVIHYQPQLYLQFVGPPPDQLVHYDDGKAWQPPALTYRLEAENGPLELQELLPLLKNEKVTVRINGEPLAGAGTFDAEKGTVSVTLKPAGRDSVRVQLSNPWWPKQVMAAKPVAVQLFRVPNQLQFVEVPAQAGKSVIDLTAQVQSPFDLLPQLTEASVNGVSVSRVEFEKQKDDRWLVRLQGVSLDATPDRENRVRLIVGNKDGKARTEAVALVKSPKQEPPPRPVVKLLSQGGTSNPDDLRLELRVQSDSPVTYLVLEREGQQIGQVFDASKLPPKMEFKVKLKPSWGGPDIAIKPIDLAALKPNSEGFLEVESALKMQPGFNHFTLRAANAGGEGKAEAKGINVVPPVPRLKLALETDKGEPIGAVNADGKLPQTAPKGKVMLVGRVLWYDEADPLLKSPQTIRVRVNGYRQEISVPLNPPSVKQPLEREFRLALVLTSAKDNHVLLELGKLTIDQASPREFRMDCAAPLPERRFLHLVLIGLNEKSPQQFRDRVLTTLGGKLVRGTEEIGGDDGFTTGRLYGPLTHKRDVTPEQVLSQFFQIENNIKLFKDVGRFGVEAQQNHLVLVYYKGGESVDLKAAESAGRHYLKTAEGNLYSAGLEEKLSDLQGAPVLLLDVESDLAPNSKDLPFRSLADASLAVMRAAQGKSAALDPRLGLLIAWEKALGRTNRLGELEKLVREHFVLVQKESQGAVQYTQAIPHGFDELVIGSGPRPK